MTTAEPDDAGFDRRADDSCKRWQDESTPRGTAPTGTEEPLWVLASIVLGLVALTGSILVFALTAIAGLIVFLTHVPDTGTARSGLDRLGGPVNGPGFWR